jgi:hypothetical protein
LWTGWSLQKVWTFGCSLYCGFSRFFRLKILRLRVEIWFLDTTIRSVNVGQAFVIRDFFDFKKGTVFWFFQTVQPFSFIFVTIENCSRFTDFYILHLKLISFWYNKIFYLLTI